MEEKKLDRFPEGVLEHISSILGDYKTGSEISELLRNAGYPEKSHLIGTKWRFLYALFKEFNDKPDGQFHIAKIVQAFCDPTQWIGRESVRKQVMNALNEGLVYVKLQFNEDGKIIVSPVKITHAVSDEPQNASIPSKPMTITPVFRSRDIDRDEYLCFVLIPFKAPFDRLYKEKIKPAVEACKFKCLRANDLFTPTPILEDIWVHVCKSRVIIADVTGKNPNVFYEVGIAHTVGKPVIIITQDKNDVPFDISQFRYFVYSDDTEGWNKLCSSITLALESIIKEAYED